MLAISSKVFYVLQRFTFKGRYPVNNTRIRTHPHDLELRYISGVASILRLSLLFIGVASANLDFLLSFEPGAYKLSGIPS